MSEYISKYTGSEIDEGIAKAKTALQSLPAHTHSYNDLTDKPTVSASVAYNLLDNSDFSNPINQRGASSYTGAAYAIDRWRSWTDSNTLTIHDGYITTTGDYAQYIMGLADGAYSAFAMRTDGTLIRINTGYESANDWRYVSLPAGSYVWAALYKGEYTVETCPAYVPKGYAVELTECMRYFVARDPSAHGFTSAAEYGLFKAVIPMPMRIVPSVSFSNASAVGYVRVSGSQHVSSLSNISVNAANGNVITIKVFPNDSFTHIRHAAVFFSENTSMYFSADL